MMKKALSIILLSILPLSLFARVASVKSADITAYKYVSDDIFDTSITPEINLEIRDASEVALNNGGEIKIPASAVDSETRILGYVISGNDKNPFSLEFTFNPLSSGTHLVNYQIDFTPTTTTISNQDFEGRTVSIPHQDRNSSYLFKYTGSHSVSNDGATVSGQAVNLVINYTTSVSLTPSSAPAYNRIDHWVRKGEISITIPSSANSGLPAGRYTGPLYVVLTSGG